MTVEVRGFRELERGTERLAGKIGDEAAGRFLGVAEGVALEVAVGLPRRSGALAASVSTAGVTRGAQVGLGGAGTPYAGWIEFGGVRLGRGGGAAVRPYIATGRTLFPAVRAAEPVLIAAAEKAAEDEIGGFVWATVKP